MMQCFAITSLVTILWVVYGYSLALTPGSEPLNAIIGGTAKLFMRGVGPDSLSGTIPESVFMCFQMTFAIITPALIVGAIAERMKFSEMMIYIGRASCRERAGRVDHGCRRNIKKKNNK